MSREGSATGRRIELDRTRALSLLGTVPLGRLVFTRRALPTIRPVNHIVDGGDIVIRIHEDAAVALSTPPDGDGVVVAYEADSIDADTHAGWSVVVTGYARLVTDTADLTRIRGLLEPWIPRQEMDHAVRIRPELVTGVLLTGTENQQ
ncbi:pyridoxamine 5'-phosphate oxidase family protein [Streptomyces sp. NPDC086787]|uniref:pyridoxamine 5'-phosphate oxidase family protein n=1 Tax=Streptomyces sp. NPDC086787 TaxID=3365759 RepID=UPI0037F3951A